VGGGGGAPPPPGRGELGRPGGSGGGRAKVRKSHWEMGKNARGECVAGVV
jgi:hypothetical protein